MFLFPRLLSFDFSYDLDHWAEAGIPTTLYFLYFPIFPYNLNPPYFSLYFHDFWPKNPVFPYIFSMAPPWSDNLEGVCM